MATIRGCLDLTFLFPSYPLGATQPFPNHFRSPLLGVSWTRPVHGSLVSEIPFLTFETCLCPFPPPILPTQQVHVCLRWFYLEPSCLERELVVNSPYTPKCEQTNSRARIRVMAMLQIESLVGVRIQCRPTCMHFWSIATSSRVLMHTQFVRACSMVRYIWLGPAGD